MAIDEIKRNPSQYQINQNHTVYDSNHRARQTTRTHCELIITIPNTTMAAPYIYLIFFSDRCTSMWDNTLGPKTAPISEPVEIGRASCRDTMQHQVPAV